jgi:hypothetical protein
MSNYQYQNEEMEQEGDDQQISAQAAELAQASVPSSLKGVRACKRCGILKTIDQFIEEGCENCPFLDMVSRYIFQGTVAYCTASISNDLPSYD